MTRTGLLIYVTFVDGRSSVTKRYALESTRISEPCVSVQDISKLLLKLLCGVARLLWYSIGARARAEGLPRVAYRE